MVSSLKKAGSHLCRLPPFGIYLAKIEKEPYRIQIEGYMQEDATDASKTLLLMFNEEVQKQVRVRPGDEKPTQNLKS